MNVPCIGGRFTWFNNVGSSIGRLDRFLISDDLNVSWNIVVQFVGIRDISNHCPIWLKASSEN